MFRFLRRTRPAPVVPAVSVIDVSEFTGQHTAACTDLVAVPQPLSPLVTELIALHAHTRHLSWLSERERCPAEYQLLARSIVRQVLAGWHHQTGGRGTIDDLLTDHTRPAHASAQGAPSPESGPSSGTASAQAAEGGR